MKHDPIKKIVGKIGEDLAARYLGNKGFLVVERNYLRKWGEIDIVAEKHGTTHFIEVKTVTRDLIDCLPRSEASPRDSTTGVSCEIPDVGFQVKPEVVGHRPEDNVHLEKLRRMARVIQTYLLDKKIGAGNWQFDVVTVLLDRKNKKAKIDLIPNIVL